MSAIDKLTSELLPKHEDLKEVHDVSEHANRLRQHHEQSTPHHEEDRKNELHEAHKEAFERASGIKEADPRGHLHESSTERHQGPITKKQLDREFNKTMTAVQDEMSPTKRTFSKLIHMPVVEKTSDLLGATVARPNALFAGALGAFGLTLALYLFAKNVGYPLSGFESIASFLVGWILGLLYDYFRIMVTGKQ